MKKICGFKNIPIRVHEASIKFVMYAVTPTLMLGILINETPTGKHYAVVFNKYLKFRELKLCFNLVYCCSSYKMFKKGL